MTAPVCPHGSLARSCEVCERDAEIAALRAQLAEAGRERDHVRAPFDMLQTEVEDAVGALEDANVRRNDDDEIASGIEKLAKDRDELLAMWNAVGSIFWPNREADDGWSDVEIADEVKELRSRALLAESEKEDGR